MSKKVEKDEENYKRRHEEERSGRKEKRNEICILEFGKDFHQIGKKRLDHAFATSVSFQLHKKLGKESILGQVIYSFYFIMRIFFF